MCCAGILLAPNIPKQWIQQIGVATQFLPTARAHIRNLHTSRFRKWKSLLAYNSRRDVALGTIQLGSVLGRRSRCADLGNVSLDRASPRIIRGAMKTGLHYAVHCSDCGETIPLPEQTLDQITQSPVGPSTGKEIAALVCSSYKHARTQNCCELTPASAFGPVEVLSHFGGWIVTGWLQCKCRLSLMRRLWHFCSTFSVNV
jgi:hypothetical protein